ncbi:MAG: class I SAM-dependent methyltransferase [Rhodospirillaceae bacterium]|jgi:SAM-dependent methyltransferase|nr:class I SAM-dependent methyltransferase [Rhodospirillaceae bacterium]MBT5459879.1 class I SAM-dependent methyltransferase [Rhodospirillaceae bacterium]
MSDKPEKDEPIEDWESYYEKTGTRPPRKTLIFALDRFDRELGADDRRFAIDLGCGNGRDTIELLRRSWHVLAVDAEKSATDGLRAREDLPDGALLDTHEGRFEAMEFPAADLVNSSFALPLVAPLDFPDLWDRLLGAVRGGGRISCQLYGDRDSWVGRPGMTFFTKGGVEALLEPLDLEYFQEEEDDSVTPRGQQKHWHIFHIVARKPIIAGRT